MATDNILADGVDLNDVHTIMEDETHLHVHHAKNGRMSLAKSDMDPEMVKHVQSVKRGLEAADKALQTHQDEQGVLHASDGAGPTAFGNDGLQQPDPTFAGGATFWNPETQQFQPSPVVAAPEVREPEVPAPTVPAPRGDRVPMFGDSGLGDSGTPRKPSPLDVIADAARGARDYAFPPELSLDPSGRPKTPYVPDPSLQQPATAVPPEAQVLSTGKLGNGPGDTPIPSGASGSSRPGQGQLSASTWRGPGKWEGGPDFDAAVGEKAEAARRSGMLAAAASTRKAQIQDQRNQYMQSLDDEFGRRMTENQKNQAAKFAWLQDPNNALDPRRLFHAQSTGQSVMSGISVLLGGLAGGMGHTTNIGLEMINKAVNDDVDAQKSTRQDQWNQVRYYMESGRSLQDAHRLAKADALDTTAGLLNAVTDRFAGPQAKAEMADKIAQIKLDAMNNRKVAEMNDIHLKSLPQQLKMASDLQQSQLDESQARIQNYRRVAEFNSHMMDSMGGGNSDEDMLRRGRFYDPKTGTFDMQKAAAVHIPFPSFSKDADGNLLPTAINPKTGVPSPTMQIRETRDADPKEARTKLLEWQSGHNALGFLEKFWNDHPQGGLGLKPGANVEYDNAINQLQAIWTKAHEGIGRYTEAEGNLNRASAGGAPGFWNAATEKGPIGVKLMRSALQKDLDAIEENEFYPAERKR